MAALRPRLFEALKLRRPSVRWIASSCKVMRVFERISRFVEDCDSGVEWMAERKRWQSGLRQEECRTAMAGWREGATNTVKYYYCMRLAASFAGVAKPGQRRWIQGPVTKVFVGSNPIPRTYTYRFWLFSSFKIPLWETGFSLTRCFKDDAR